MNNKAHLRPKDFDNNGDIIPMACKEEKGDLVSRKWLTDAIRNRRTYLSYEDAKDVIDLIDNAPTVDIKDQIAGAYNEGYACGSRENTRPQGEWINESRDSLLCTCCNKRIYKPFIGGFPTERSQHYYPNFCAFCGADMRKEDKK